MVSLPPPPPPPARPTPPDVASGARIRDQVAARLRQRPSVIEAAMVILAAISYYLHGYGIGLSVILAAWVLWIFLWIGWTRTRSGPLGPVVSLGVFIAILWGSPSWQLGFEIEAECLQAHADAALASADIDSPWMGPGNCGRLRWSELGAHPTVLRDAPVGAERETTLVAWFAGAGTTNWVLFGGNALVYSPAGEPRCPWRAAGDVHSCEMNDLGDGWYYVRYSTGIN